MELASLRPRAQLFVCANVRAPSDPLSSACGAHGPAVYAALKRAVAAAGCVSEVWVTRTGCLGHCPPRGCTVVLYPVNEQWVNVSESDAPALVARALALKGKSDMG